MFQRREIFTISIDLLKYSSDVFLNISKFIGNSQYCGVIIICFCCCDYPVTENYHFVGKPEAI